MSIPRTIAAVALVPREERVTRGRLVAKATLESGNKVTATPEWKPLAAAMRRAISLANLTDKEAAGHALTTPQQLAMMLACDKRPQIERFYASDALRGPMLIAQAEQDPTRFDVVTTITVRSAR
jgi:hypothetical protein